MLLREESGIYLFLFLTYIFTVYLRNIHEKKFVPTKHPREKFRAHDIPTRRNLGPKKCPQKNLGPTIYPRQEILEARNTR